MWLEIIFQISNTSLIITFRERKNHSTITTAAHTGTSTADTGSFSGAPTLPRDDGTMTAAADPETPANSDVDYIPSDEVSDEVASNENEVSYIKKGEPRKRKKKSQFSKIAKNEQIIKKIAR